MTLFSSEALFDSYTMLKPQVGTSFALQSLIGKKAVVWNDFRWPHGPLAWADMLDNESFQIAVPKTDGAVDYERNRSGQENVICVLTSNDPIVYVSGNAVNKLETSAWNERFGAMIHFSARPCFQASFRNAQGVILSGCLALLPQLHARPSVDLQPLKLSVLGHPQVCIDLSRSPCGAACVKNSVQRVCRSVMLLNTEKSRTAA